MLSFSVLAELKVYAQFLSACAASQLIMTFSANSRFHHSKHNVKLLLFLSVSRNLMKNWPKT